MIANLVWSGIIVAVLLSWVFFAAWIWFRSSDRSSDEVAEFLTPVDLEKLQTLLDPVAESQLRREMPAAEFRKQQRKRILVCLEFLNRMCRNCAILVQWANTEIERDDEETLALAQAIQRDAVAARVYALAARYKLRLWLLLHLDAWRLLPTPSLADMREVSGISGVDTYDRLKTAVGCLFLQLQHHQFEEVLENL